MPGNEEENYTPEKLIKFIEYQALKDIVDINLSSEEENNINLESVYTWYLETEKLMRIIANIIPSTMAQPINQLRYAGHHILKAEYIPHASNQSYGNPNLVEAYKHCKRAYFDTLDLYVYHMSDIFRSKVNLLNFSDDKLSDKIIHHLDSFTELRLNCENRIDYYSGVSKTLKDGLTLINAINKELKSQGITDSFLKDKGILIQGNIELKNDNKKLKKVIDESISKADRKFNKYAFWFSIILMIVTALSILFQGYFTEKWVISESKNSLMIDGIPMLHHDLPQITNPKLSVKPLLDKNNLIEKK